MLPGHATKRPRPRTRYPGALKASLPPPWLIVQRCPSCPAAASEAKGLRRRCDGAVPGRDRWHGSSVSRRSPPSLELKMGLPLPDRPACSAPPTESAWTPLRETRDGTPTTRRARSSLASEPHTKRNASRRHTHRVTPPPVTQAAATPSSPSTRTEVARLTSGSCGRCSRPWARSRPRRSSSR